MFSSLGFTFLCNLCVFLLYLWSFPSVLWFPLVLCSFWGHFSACPPCTSQILKPVSVANKADSLPSSSVEERRSNAGRPPVIRHVPLKPPMPRPWGNWKGLSRFPPRFQKLFGGANSLQPKASVVNSFHTGPPRAEQESQKHGGWQVDPFPPTRLCHTARGPPARSMAFAVNHSALGVHLHLPLLLAVPSLCWGFWDQPTQANCRTPWGRSPATTPDFHPQGVEGSLVASWVWYPKPTDFLKPKI